METKLAHFRRRASEEYLAHANAADTEVRSYHLELAKHFESLAVAEATHLSAAETEIIEIKPAMEFS